MAVQLKLVRRVDFSSDIDSISLLSNTDGFDLAANGWDEVLANGDEDFVTEAMILRGKGTSHNNLATKLQGLIDKLVQAGWFRKSSIEQYGVWLRAQLANESNARQALVCSASVGKLPLHTYPALNSSALPQVGLAIDRKPLWEDTTNATIADSNISTVGGMVTTAYGTVYGDMPGRLADVIFYQIDGSGGGPISDVWLGFRSARYGTPANFKSTWSLRLASTIGTDTSGGTTNADATAKDGYKTITTFATAAGLVERARIKVSDVTANRSDQRGSFLALLRAKTTSTAACRVRLADGLFGGENFRFRSRVVISNTSWGLYPLGTVQLPPPGRLLSLSNYLDSAAMRIDAERYSGSGNLEMDCLILIPNDEGFVHSSDGNIQYSGPYSELHVLDMPDGRKASLRYESGFVDSGSPHVDGGVPPGTSGAIVLAGQRDGSSVLTDTLDLTIHYYQRWLSLRGSE